MAEASSKVDKKTKSFLFSSESVTSGHPDKLCDAVSDAVLDACLAVDPRSKVACESASKTGMIMVLGEITTSAVLDYQKIIRRIPGGDEFKPSPCISKWLWRLSFLLSLRVRLRILINTLLLSGLIRPLAAVASSPCGGPAAVPCRSRSRTG